MSSRVTLMLAAGRRRACSRAVRTIDRTADRTVDRHRGPVRALTEPSALRVYVGSAYIFLFKHDSHRTVPQLQGMLYTVKRTVLTGTYGMFMIVTPLTT